MRSIKESMMEALNEAKNIPSNIKIPVRIIISCVANEEGDNIIEYLDDNGVEDADALGEQLWDICRWWEAKYCENTEATTWERELAYNNVSDTGVDASQMKRLVQKCEKTMQQEHGQIELECFPKSSDSIYNKTRTFSIFCNEDMFGWMAIPKDVKRSDREFFENIVGGD